MSNSNFSVPVFFWNLNFPSFGSYSMYMISLTVNWKVLKAELNSLTECDQL